MDPCEENREEIAYRQEGKSYLPFVGADRITIAMSDVRKFVESRIEELGLDMASVSKAVGRNHAYIQQYIQRGTPKILPEGTRKLLAEVLRCKEGDLKEAAHVRDAVSALAIKGPILVPGSRGPTVGPTLDRTLPIYGRAQAGNYGVAIIGSDDRPIDWTFMPPQLEGVDGAYGTFVYGDSMYPAYAHGDIAFIHPSAPFKTGDDVHIIMNTDEAFVKRYISRRGGLITVEQFKPAKVIEIAEADIREIRRVVGRWNG